MRCSAATRTSLIVVPGPAARAPGVVISPMSRVRKTNPNPSPSVRGRWSVSGAGHRRRRRRCDWQTAARDPRRVVGPAQPRKSRGGVQRNGWGVQLGPQPVQRGTVRTLHDPNWIYIRLINEVPPVRGSTPQCLGQPSPGHRVTSAAGQHRLPKPCLIQAMVCAQTGRSTSRGSPAGQAVIRPMRVIHEPR